MNRTIISIEVQDESDRKTIIITRGERNSQMMFEESFLSLFLFVVRKSTNIFQ
mgnify:CR=1 FL=1